MIAMTARGGGGAGEGRPRCESAQRVLCRSRTALRAWFSDPAISHFGQLLAAALTSGCPQLLEEPVDDDRRGFAGVLLLAVEKGA